MWLENNISNNINDEIKKYAIINTYDFSKEKKDTFLENKNIKKNLHSNIKNGITYYSDFTRMLLLYKYGGCWFDLDVLFLRDFSPLFSKFSDEICLYAWGKENYPNNAIIISLEPYSNKLKNIIE